MKHLAEYLPVAVAILLAIILTAVLYATDKGLVTSALLGSSLAVLSVWFTFFSMYRLIMFATRGAPYRVGDFVRVTTGDDTGEEGEVTKLADGFLAVFLRLEGKGRDREERYFAWDQVTRRGVTKNTRTRCSTTNA